MKTQTEIISALIATPGTLTDTELLACVLSKNPGAPQLKAAKKLLGGDGKIGFTGGMIGERTVLYSTRLRALKELGKRLGNRTASIFLKPKDVWETLREVREAKKEHFIVFFLDSRNAEIMRETVSIGCLNANLVHPREVFEPAIRNLAASVIVAHNHPSGNLEPSQEDIDLTKRLVGGGKLLGIEVLDHVIVSRTGFSSFKEKGLI